MTKIIITFFAVGGLLLGANAQALTFMNNSKSVTLEFKGQSVSSTSLNNNAAGAESFSSNSAHNFIFDISAMSGSVSAPAFTTTLASTGGRITLMSGKPGPSAATIVKTFCESNSDATKVNSQACGADVTHDYTDVPVPPVEVPAPTSLLLIGVGLLGFVGIRRANKPS